MGYVGKDVEQIIRDLIEIAIAMEKEKEEKRFMQRLKACGRKVLDALRKAS